MAATAKELLSLGVASFPTGGKGLALPRNGTQPLMLASPGAHKIAFGTGTLVFPGGAPGSNNLTITHGLGTTPTVALATAASAPTTSKEVAVRVISLTSTTFVISGTAVDAANQSGNTTVYWIAIG